MKSIRTILIIVILIVSLLWVLFEYNKTTPEYLYGNSYRQNKTVNTIRLHKYTITGIGVTIGIIDAGFYTKHEAFKNTRILKEFDFVTNKPTTINYEHVRGMEHGTNVFSIIGGYKANELMGIAYGANYILAKTDISSDRLVEEERLAVKASKWLYENNVNIITTSLSFNKFDNADYYYPTQMNGRTALITRTADSLTRKGIVFICSAGNQYEEAWHIIEPPADGFKVLAVGSINKELKHSFFSSCGPTVDGRIKPDIIAPGEGVWNANYATKLNPEYWWNHGTSLAAPIAAGIAALILSTHPELSVDQVIEAIKNTSSKHGNPDNLFGWGIPDAEKAVTYFGPAFSNIPELIDRGNQLEVRTYVFSRYGLNENSVELHLLVNNDGKESVYKMIEKKDNFYSCILGINLNKEEAKIYFKAKDMRGFITKFPSSFLGNYFTCRMSNGKPELINGN